MHGCCHCDNHLRLAINVLPDQKLFTATIVPEKKLFSLKTSYNNEDNLQVSDDNILSATKLADSSATKTSGVVSSQVSCSSPSPSRSLDSVSAVVSTSLSQSLSPHAENWIPTANTKVKNLDLLYPPGRNPAGIDYKISDEAWVELVELSEKSSQDFDLPVDAKPD